jgi:hypothetical protein
MLFTNKMFENRLSQLLLDHRLGFPVETSVRNKVMSKLKLEILIWRFGRQGQHISTELTVKLAIL